MKYWDTSFTAKSISAEDVADLKVKIPPSFPLPRLKHLPAEAGLRLSTDPKFYLQESEVPRRSTNPTPKLDTSKADASAFVTAPAADTEDSLPVIGQVRPGRARYLEKAYYGTGILKDSSRRKVTQSQSERRPTPCKACEFRHEIEEAYFASFRPKTAQISNNSMRTSQDLKQKTSVVDGVSAYLEAVSADSSQPQLQVEGDSQTTEHIRQIEFMWEKLKVPSKDRNSVRQLYSSADKAEQIADYYQMLTQFFDETNRIMTLIEARETHLQVLKSAVLGGVRLSRAASEIVPKLLEIRKYTVEIVEGIKNWRVTAT